MFISITFGSWYKLVIAGRRLVENQYCVGSLRASGYPSLGLGQGVGLDEVQIEAKTLNFK